MGVHSLWKILEPSSKAVRLESLTKKKLAIDASIWVYQFLKAVRDKSGASLSKSHIVGFFRRICKLIYFGILPVFVFDGGAPALKRQTILKRKERRQGKRDNAESTAKRLLAIQLQKQQESPTKKKGEEDDDVQYKYMSDLDKPEERPIFKGSDEYDLPKIEGFQYKKSDTRLITDSDIDTSNITQVSKDELDGIDLNTIDPSSKEFENLPLTTQYMVLSQLRLRSRLRMGYSKEQLEDIFPSSLDFSKFQIKMVQKRNYFTQKLMGISGMDVDVEKKHEEIKRVAGERGKAYKISKNEGGWSLSLEDDTTGTSKNPIDLDRELKKQKQKEENPLKKFNSDEDDSDIEWEDIPLDTASQKPKMSYSIGSLPLPPRAKEMDESGTIRSFTFSPEKRRTKKAEEDDEFEEDTIDQIEEIELIEAIAKSKKDLQHDLELEKEIEETKEQDESALPVIEEDEDEEAIDIFEDIEMPQTLPKPRQQPKQIISPPKLQFRSEMDHLFHLGPQSDPQQTETSLRKESAPSQISESSQAERTVPSWFNSDFDISIKNSSILNPNPKTTSKDDNLVPWFEAREIINNQKEDEGFEVVEIIDKANTNDDEVIEVNNNETNTSEEVVVAKPDEPAKSKEEAVEVPQVAPQPTQNIMDYEFFESDEEELETQLHEEEKEHEQFTKDLNPHIINSFIDTESSLQKQHAKDLRDSDEVTQDMIKDVQELLSYFGIPYITAPMEAEAQCAELLQLGLVDGIITDDSDVFLFGGDRVYKNMFHEKHYVEYYNGANLEKELGLDRIKLIYLAHLLGSDYTEGLKGIGPVNAMEILAQFDGSLEDFRNWFIDGQFDIVKQKEESTFLKNLRKKLIKNDVLIDLKFPDKNIDQAYLQPEVDSDKTKFKWGKPDLDRIREFLIERVGWTKVRVDEILLPLIKDLNKREREGAQSTITEFYDIDELRGFSKPKKNKRIEQASGRIKKRKK